MTKNLVRQRRKVSCQANAVTDPAVESFKKYKRSRRAFDTAYEARDVAESKLWQPHPKGSLSCVFPMESPSCVFPDEQRDAERRDYKKRYAKARAAAGLANFDAAMKKTRKEYWASFAAMVKTESTSLAGVLAKADLAYMNRYGETPYDAALIKSIRRDLKRLNVSESGAHHV